MSEQVVKRYDPECHEHICRLKFEECAGADWVKSADYDALHAEAEALRVALAGMLFAFDDGVGQEWSKPLLDHARTLTPAKEYKP